MRQRLNWIAAHGLLRGAARLAVRLGNVQSRLAADPMVMANPAPFCDELRAIGPVVSSYGTHLVVSHAIAHELLRSEDFEVISLGSNLPAPMRWLERRTRDDTPHLLLPPSLLAVEPPNHTRYRKAVSSVFTPKAVAGLRDHVEETASALLDQLTDQASAVDIIARYCSRLPAAVICDILGVPSRDRNRVLKFGQLTGPCLDLGLTWRQHQQVRQGLQGLHLWITEHLEELRSNPGDDLMSQMIHASENGSSETRLHATEVRMIGLVLGTSFATTTDLLGSGIQLLLDAPELRDALSQRPQLWPNAVEEILRLEPPVQLAGRMARKDTEVAGTAIKRGQLVVIYLGAVNRDPSVFADPHRFDITRANANRHLAFSGGRHFCLGAALARVEGEVGLRMLFERFPDVRAAGPGNRRDTRTLRGWSQLPVQLGAARSTAIR
ncbi:mycolactone biosynthesis cytochrome P450 [Mycobacterium ulcerans]|uniref:mycolactone biosynthesis cytochrome P450 n=1 Tax=Mycobacterium ulcerans TaxID=1809 RepID=UPI000BBB3E43|nr:mycolactone biosynthesis cytochrome P450 [Mycobacterium ulcerans]